MAEQPNLRRAARHVWALLLARIYDQRKSPWDDQRKSPWDEVFPLLCPKCGSKMRIIAFITDAVAVRDIHAHLGEATSPPRLMPARGAPLWGMAHAGREEDDAQADDPQAQRAPDYQFDQRVAW